MNNHNDHNGYSNNKQYKGYYSGYNQKSGTAANLAQKYPGHEGEFYNPYTFIPFPKTNISARHAPSYLTVDEREKDRFTGVLNLKVKTLSPLLSCEAEYDDKLSDGPNGHKVYHTLTMGNDAVVPATAIRGSLRTLMTILTGNTLGYMDTNIWLCQGRDAQLGPGNASKYQNVFLGRVIEAGNSQHDGTIQLGETRLILAEKLEALLKLYGNKTNLSKFRPTTGQSKLFIDSFNNPKHFDTHETPTCKYEVKLSGRPINKKYKREGVFLANGNPIPIPAQLWAEYQGRYRFGYRPELKKGDLIWLEPVDPKATRICSSSDIASLQWARWGRHGASLKESLPKNVVPDCLNNDGKVDMTTDLWGQVPMEESKAPSFTTRIRPHNLIFSGWADKVEREVTLAPLSAPHPGCVAMYRNDEANLISQKSELNGYKVYRNSTEHGETAPWHYAVQGVYEGEKLKDPRQKVNKTVDLIPEGATGTLKISCRALSKLELALLLLTCSVDWKLGGGKPLGLGHCQVTELTLQDENGDCVLTMQRTSEDKNITLPDEYANLLKFLDNRVELYSKSQKPVDNMRYPRAAGSNMGKDNKENINLNALQWFGRHAAPGKSGKGGLQVLRMKNKIYQGQVLRSIDKNNQPFYGYDMLPKTFKDSQNKNIIESWHTFDPNTDRSLGQRHENHSANHETRLYTKNTRIETLHTQAPEQVTRKKIFAPTDITITKSATPNIGDYIVGRLISEKKKIRLDCPELRNHCGISKETLQIAEFEINDLVVCKIRGNNQGSYMVDFVGLYNG